MAEGCAMKLLIKALVLTLLLNVHLALAESIKPFVMNSRAAIEQAHAGQPMILAFWSIDCGYCLDELATVAEFVNKHPKIKMVLVNVDGASTAQEISKSLKQMHLQSFESWQFAEADEERLRFSIDKAWYGELPRTYYYDANYQSKHQVQAFSGSPDSAWLKAWASKY